MNRYPALLGTEQLAVARLPKEHLCGAPSTVSVRSTAFLKETPDAFDRMCMNDPIVRVALVLLGSGRLSSGRRCGWRLGCDCGRYATPAGVPDSSLHLFRALTHRVGLCRPSGLGWLIRPAGSLAARAGSALFGDCGGSELDAGRWRIGGCGLGGRLRRFGWAVTLTAADGDLASRIGVGFAGA